VLSASTERFPPPQGENEDAYFTPTVRRIGGAMPDFETATRFSVESVYTTHPVGVHGTDRFYHDVQVAKKITRAISY
jgi:hypothetical protein